MIQTSTFSVSRGTYFRLHLLRRVIRLWLPLVLFIGIGLIVWFRTHSAWGFTSLGIFFGIYLLMALFAAYTMAIRYKDESAFAPKRIIVEDRQLMVEIDGMQPGEAPTVYEVPFTAIVRTITFGGHVLLYTSKHHFFAVPFSAFINREERQQFIDAIKKEAPTR